MRWRWKEVFSEQRIVLVKCIEPQKSVCWLGPPGQGAETEVQELLGVGVMALKDKREKEQD